MNRDRIKNILLISVEDLNDWIGPLGGHPQAYTPNLNKLASRSTVFNQAYAAAPACSPSRTSTLFGQAPWRIGMYTNKHSWATFYKPGDRKSIVGQARLAGWRTIGAGKVFHTGASGLDMADWDDYFHTGTDQFSPVSKMAKSGLGGWHDDFGPIPNNCPPMLDDRTVAYMISKMENGATGNFWCFGSYRPHLPFIVPQRYFDLFPTVVREPLGLMGKPFDAADTTELESLPLEARIIATRGLGHKLQESGEYNAFLRAYLASIAYADGVVGRLLDHMEKQGLLDSTLVVFWSDHGWQLGEKLCFRKFTLWERALKVPLFISGPGILPAQSSEPVSLLDIYPTLQSLLGTTAPHSMDGQDLAGVLSGAKGRGYAASAWQRIDKAAGEESKISVTVRNASYRLILYPGFEAELYETGTDPFERNNLLTGLDNVPANLEAVVEDLLTCLPQEISDAHLEDISTPLATFRSEETVQIF